MFILRTLKISPCCRWRISTSLNGFALFKCPRSKPPLLVNIRSRPPSTTITRGARHLRTRCWGHRITDPKQFPQIGAGGSSAKKPCHFWPLWATPAAAQTTWSAAAMAVPSSIETGTPAPAVRLPLDPVPTHRNGTPFAQESGARLDLYARSAPTGQLATE